MLTTIKGSFEGDNMQTLKYEIAMEIDEKS